jgi:energy-coupling factor transporter transmembrane protein EcfT
MYFFGLIFIIFLVIISFVLFFIAGITEKRIFIKMIIGLWIFVLLLVIFSSVVSLIMKKKELKKSDYYGEYIIDRSFFKGKQADWQYNTFRFEIKENDSIYFYVTNKDKILERHIGRIKTTTSYISERLIVNMKEPSYHVLATNPTTHRNTWDFYLVFESPKFKNMYFKKGKWKPIDSE